MKHAKMGALIAIAAGGLFVSGCKKEEKGSENKEPAPKAEPEKKPDPAATKAEEKPTEAPPEEKTAMVDCMGVNACKGQGTCKTDKHGCGGQNECKGQGVLAMTEGECLDKGGTVFAKK